MNIVGQKFNELTVISHNTRYDDGDIKCECLCSCGKIHFVRKWALKCGSVKNLQAHHLNSWNKFPDERFKLENGVTLCKSCHDDFHNKFGRGNNTAEQFRKYYENINN